jgi:DNA-directed RNA polymerase subunit RPC12/RpoP
MIYCYRCEDCGARLERATRTAPFRCPECDGAVTMKRDYQAEGVGIGAGVLASKMSKGVQDARTFHQWAEGEADAVGLK